MKKKLKYGLYIVLLFLWSGLMLSCIKEDGLLDEYAGNTTDVVLTVSRGIGSGSATDSKEGIKKMRVIVASVAANGAETLLRNEVVLDGTSNYTSYQVELNGLPRGLTKFYVVCNEGSLPESTRNYLSGLTTEGTPLSDFATYVVKDENRSSFPKLRIDIGDNVGIPITGISETVDLQKKNEAISFGIQYMVAKITVNVTNNDKVSSITPNGFMMSSFFPNKAYLFPQAKTVPDNTTYVGWTFNIACDPILGGTKTEGVMNLYVYPSEITGQYTAALRLSSNNWFYNAIPFFRGTALDRGVYAELNGIFGTNPTPGFSYTVNEWEDGGTNDVPAFD